MDRKLKARLEPVIKMAKEDKEIIAVILFGSAARGEKYRDVDVALVVDTQLSALLMSKKRLKYLSAFPDIDVQIFNKLPIYIRKRVLEDGKVLLFNDYDKAYDIAIDTIREFDDFRPYYEDYLEATMNA
ncbi:MAG: nucleotidyltransferase domain-containing protein [archaeon]